MSEVLESHWDIPWLLLSFCVAFLGSYITVFLADQFRNLYSVKSYCYNQKMALWFMAISLGGVASWSMHFISMGALVIKTQDEKRVTLFCDPFLTVVSLICAVVFSYCGIHFASQGRGYIADKRRLYRMLITAAAEEPDESVQSTVDILKLAFKAGFIQIAVGGVITAAGLCIMHHVGMMGILLPARIEYNWGLILVSVFIAWIGATGAVWLFFVVLPLRPDVQFIRIAVSIILSATLCGVHHIALAGTRFIYNASNDQYAAVDIVTAAYIALAVGMGVLCIIIIVILTNLQSWHVSMTDFIEYTDRLIDDVSSGKTANLDFSRIYKSSKSNSILAMMLNSGSSSDELHIRPRKDMRSVIPTTIFSGESQDANHPNEQLHRLRALVKSAIHIEADENHDKTDASISLV